MTIEQAREHLGATLHEHEWRVVYVAYDEATPSTELSCSCGEISYSVA